LFRALVREQKQLRVQDRPRYLESMRRLITSYMLQLFGLAGIVSLMVYRAAQWHPDIHAQGIRFTLVSALAAIPFLVFGLFNTNVQFRFASTTGPVASIGLSAVVNLAAGYICSRVGGFEYAVLGFLAGSITFAVVSSCASLRLLKSADYNYFASAL
jgi:hypothetical protein